MILFNDLSKINAPLAPELEEASRRVINSGWYLRGKETSEFERRYAEYTGTSYCVGCGNGLDALTLIIKAYMCMQYMHEGDEIIVPANTYIASILAITRCRLKPVLIEPDINTLQIDDRLIEQAITPLTRAVMIVHLYGRCAYTERIADICRRHELFLIEDNAQAHGCTFKGRRTGSLGSAAGHSFYPTKNLGALGDAGAVTTDDEELADFVRQLANYGMSKKYVFDHAGVNSRIDELQAAFLNVKLPHLDETNSRRRAIARFYIDNIHNENVALPSEDYWANSVFHIFPVLSPRRDELKTWLAENGVQTDIHYPIPPHKQYCYSMWEKKPFPVTERIHREVLSLPVNPSLTDAEVEEVVRQVNRF